MPGWVWLIAIVVVLVLILNEVRQRSPWFAGKLSSFLSPLGGLGAKLAGSSGLKLAALAIPLVLGIGVGLKECGRREGRLQERVAQAEENARDTRAVTEAAIDEGQNFRNDADTLRGALDLGRDEIHDASQYETDALFLAWAASDRRLCDHSDGCANNRS